MRKTMFFQAIAATVSSVLAKSIYAESKNIDMKTDDICLAPKGASSIFYDSSNAVCLAPHIIPEEINIDFNQNNFKELLDLEEEEYEYEYEYEYDEDFLDNSESIDYAEEKKLPEISDLDGCDAETIKTAAKTGNKKSTKKKSSKNGSYCLDWGNNYDAKDGILNCPELPSAGIWALQRCSWKNGRIFNAPSERKAGRSMNPKNFQNLAFALLDKDLEKVKIIAENLNLRFCRVNEYDSQGKLEDSYLVFAAKNNVKNYSGPNILFRTHNPSNIVLLSWHDGSDFTSKSSKEAFRRSNALMLASNGQAKGNARIKSKCARRKVSDIAHSGNNFASVFMRAVLNRMRELSVLEMHGKKGGGIIATPGLSREMDKETLLYSFALAVRTKFNNADENFLNKLRTCADIVGSPLKRHRCRLTSTWYYSRFLTGSRAPECVKGKKNINRYLGVEFGQNIVSKPALLAFFIKYLENTFLALEHTKNPTPYFEPFFFSRDAKQQELLQLYNRTVNSQVSFEEAINKGAKIT